MANYLIIVESPAKSKTIKKFLGNNYKVLASMGHIRDLPKSQLGIDLDNDFEPKYINIRGKASLIKELKTAANNAATKIPVFYSRNMSLGINLIIALAKKAMASLGESYDIEIIEKHHNKKLDAPSGTALMIAYTLKESRPI